MSDEKLDAILAENGQDSEPILKMLNAIAICHTIVTSQDPKDESKFILNSSSPDELSLINGAKYYGV